MLFLLAGCVDSKSPLSDPLSSKPDEKLFGLWRSPGDDGQVTYYHVGLADDKRVKGAMRVVIVQQHKNEIDSPAELLMFPTILGDKTYLNVAVIQEQPSKLLKEKGWKAVDSYWILKYQVDGDKLLVWGMDADAKKQAIQEGKIKGVIEKDKPAIFTDTTENVARFVVESGDRLFSKEPGQMERICLDPKKDEPRFSPLNQSGATAAPTPPLRSLGDKLMVDKNGIIWNGNHPVGFWGIDANRISEDRLRQSGVTTRPQGQAEVAPNDPSKTKPER